MERREHRMRYLDGGLRVFIAWADPHSKSIESQSRRTSTEQNRWTRLQLFKERHARVYRAMCARRWCSQKLKPASELQVWHFHKLSRTLLTFHWKPEPEFFNRRFSARKTSEVVYDGNWLLLTGTGTCTSGLLQKIGIPGKQGKSHLLLARYRIPYVPP